MKSDSSKPTNRFQAETARHARRKSLEIQRMKPQAPTNTSECVGSFSRNIDFPFEEATLLEGPAQTSKKDAKLKGLIGNTSSSPVESPENSAGALEDVKNIEDDQEEGSEDITTLKCSSVSLIGGRREMEDALTVAPGKVGREFAFFAAYDGHGGARVANACRDRLHKLLEKELEGNSRKDIDWTKVMKACFSKMDDEVTKVDEAEEEVGSTAVVVMVGREVLVVANCGDSRAVLGSGGAAMPLSIDHKPDRPDERERLEAAGGNIINWNGYRVQGILATSRSIGDHYLKPYVISEPEVTVNKRSESDEFLVIATDGLWDVVSNELACEEVRRCLKGRIRRKFSNKNGAVKAATFLAELAMAKGSRDNISIIVVEL